MSEPSSDEHLRRAMRWARLLTVTRDEGVEGYRDTIQLLLTLEAIRPHIRPTFDAPSGRLGRPSEQWEPSPVRQLRAQSRVPRQRPHPDLHPRRPA